MSKAQGLIAAALAAVFAVNVAYATPLQHKRVSITQVAYATVPNNGNNYQMQPRYDDEATAYYQAGVIPEHPYPYSDLRDDTINNHFGDPENYPYHVQ